MPTINPLTRLETFVAGYPSQRAAATALGVSAPFLSMVLSGKKAVPSTMLRKLGLQRDTVVTTIAARKAAR